MTVRVKVVALVYWGLLCALAIGATTHSVFAVDKGQLPLSKNANSALPVAWDWSVLGKAPRTYDAPPELKLERTGIRALFYDALPYQGHPTRVFAWLGIPEHKPGIKVPAVVFIHGGGGTAADDVVKLWVSRGYACLSMDDVGSYPGAKQNPPDGGPRGNGECFEQVPRMPNEQWMYHAVADVALANSLLRSLPDVDAGKIGLTGLSWGGVVTSVVAGVDERFRWAAPVYGGGFLGESEYFKPVLEAFGKERWLALWGGENYLPHAKMPMLWIDGTNDEYFQLPATQKSYRLSAGPRTVLLNLRMPHNGGDGSRPAEILAFADSIVRGGEPLPRIEATQRIGSRVVVTLAAHSPVVSAELTCTSDDNPRWSKKQWNAEAASVSPVRKGRQTVTGILPAGTRAWYVRVTDERGLKASTGYEELSEPVAAPSAVGGPIFVAPGGNDAGLGTEASPLATLTAARNLARTRKRGFPIRIILRGGTYDIDTPLELNAADSGTAAEPVIWCAAPGEKVVISGGEPLNGWKTTTVNGKPAWTLTLPDVAKGRWYFRRLYAREGAGSSRPRARLPKSGYFTVEAVEKRKTGENDDWLSGRDRFTYRAGDLDNFPDAAEAETVVLTQWCESHLPVMAIDPAARQVTFGKFTIQNFGKDTRYWVENTRAALTEPGEWCLNRKTGVLLYLPKRGETPRNTTLIAPRAESLLRMKDVSDVRFENVAFSHSEWWFPADFRAESYNSDKVWAIQQGASGVPGAIRAEKISRCTFDRCEFAHIGSYGIALGSGAHDNRVTNCLFHDLGAGAIRIGPTDIGKNSENIAMGNMLSDCRIFDGGNLFTGAVGVWVGQAQKTQIVHNEIHDLNYSGISCGWHWGFDGTGDARDNTVAWNRIYNLGRNVLGDGAGIYMLGTQLGTVIEGNVVHDMNGTYASRGIYLDDGSSEMTIRNNLSYRNKTANFFQWRSKNNRVENNIFAFGKDAQVELGGAVFNGGALAMRFERNIVVTEPGPVFNAFAPADVKSIYQFDRNLFWNPSGKPALSDAAKAAGWGANALSANPHFVDAARDDFRLRLDSPAITQMGFIPVDWRKAGPRQPLSKAKGRATTTSLKSEQIIPFDSEIRRPTPGRIFSLIRKNDALWV